MTESRWKKFLPPAVLAALPLLYYWPVTFFGRTLVRGDIHAQFLPWKEYWRRSILEEGRIPLWNPYTACGSPFLANYQSSVFNPVDWLLIGFEPSRAFGISLLLHTILALLLVYGLARKIDISFPGAMLAALAFGFTGFHHIHLYAGNFLTFTAAIWFPFLCWMAYGLVESVRREEPFRQSLKWALGLSVATVFQVLAGHPQLFFYSLFFTALWTLALVLPGDDNRIRRTVTVLGFAFAAGAVAALVCAVQLLPTLEYIQWSTRKGGLDWEEATQFSYSWSRLITLPFPDYFGSHADHNFWGYWKNWSSAYMGVFPVFLALFALCFKVLKKVLPLTKGELEGVHEKSFPWLPVVIVGVVALLLALGRNNPLYHYVLPLPGFRYFRAPSKFLPFFILMVGLLAGRGWDDLVDPARRESLRQRIFQKRGWLWGVLFLLLFAGVAFQVGLWTAGEKWVAAKTALTGSAGHFLGFALLGWLLCVGAFWKKGRSGWLSPALIVLLTLDLFLFGSRYFILELPANWAKKDFQQHTEELFGPGYTDSCRTIFAPHFMLEPNHAFVYELYVPGFYDPMSVRHYLQWLQYYDLKDPHGAPDGLQPDNLPGPASWLTALYKFPPPEDLKRTRPDLFYQLRPILQIPPEEEEAATSSINGPYPPVVFYPKEKGRWEPYPWLFDPGQALYLAEGDASASRAALWPPPLTERLEQFTENMKVRLPSPVEVKAIRENPEKWILRYESEQPGYLFISEVWYPGWKARLTGGEQLPVFRGNFAFRAVEVPAGKHEIIHEYRPESFQKGIWLSISGIFVLFLGFLLVGGNVFRKSLSA